MKLILNMYDHSVMTHMKFHHDVTSYGDLLPFDFLNFSDFSFGPTDPL